MEGLKRALQLLCASAPAPVGVTEGTLADLCGGVPVQALATRGLKEIGMEAAGTEI